MSEIKAYQDNSVTTQPKGRLVVMLYEGAIKFLKQAADAVEASDFEKKAKFLSKAVDIITALNGSLEMESGGEVAERRSKKGRVFFSCTRYPDCKFAAWDKPRNKSCPECGGNFLVEKYGRDGKGALRCPKKGCRYKEEIKEQEAAG